MSQALATSLATIALTGTTAGTLTSAQFCVAGYYKSAANACAACASSTALLVDGTNSIMGQQFISTCQTNLAAYTTLYQVVCQSGFVAIKAGAVSNSATAIVGAGVTSILGCVNCGGP